MNLQTAGPRRNVMIGLTHTAEGQPIIREAKVLKVGIGHPRGKACDVFVNNEGKWVVRSATEQPDRKLKFDQTVICNTRAEAEAAYRAAWKKAPVCTYPRKTPYFSLTRPVIGDDGAQIYVPDFEAIEAHSFANPKKPGVPTEIDIIFFDNEPLEAAYQNWAASELRCHGDGENALRSISMAKTPEEQALAKAAQAQGQRTFPIIKGCWACGCPYSKETTVNGRTVPAPCSPSATIRFQMARNIRIGGTAFFHTGSFRSISQIVSSIERIRGLTPGGRVTGIPLKLVVRSHKTNHNGQSSVQQNVSLEFRAEDMDHLRQLVQDQSWKFDGPPPPQRMLEEPVPELEALEEEIDAEEVFDDGPGMADQELLPPAAVATASATAALSERLTQARREEPPPPPPPAVESLWPDRNAMNAAYRAQRDRIGEPRCNEIFAAHDVILASLRPEDPRAAAIYRDMLASPAVEAKKPRPEVPF